MSGTQKTAQERARELDEAVEQLEGLRDRLIAKGYTREEALELARAILPRGTCSTGQQCVAAT